MNRSYCLALIVLALFGCRVFADAKTRAAQAAVDVIIQRFGREAVKDGASALARRIEQAAIAHGDQVFKAVSNVGVKALPLIENASAPKQVARLLATHGEKGAVYVASRPQAMQLVLRHGETAAAALVKSRGIALPAIESLGKPAISAFQSIAKPQNARRLAMMVEGGELAKIGRTPELLGVLGRFGDRGMEFVWRHKGSLATVAALAAFLANPEAFITGAKDITQVVAENVVKPIAEVPGIVAKEGAAEVVRKTNWTLVFLGGIVAFVFLCPVLLAAIKRLISRLVPVRPVAPQRVPTEAK